MVDRAFVGTPPELAALFGLVALIVVVIVAAIAYFAIVKPAIRRKTAGASRD